ncbi:MAG: GIY-YIG nuclease family protein [Gammaproteobacteria bacterium]|nr:GIY-YIG nuclease family protein [Gammaproteobacteria bacterium]
MNWTVYILRCADDSLYTGIATDVERRLQEHNQGDRQGSKYTRARLPVALVYSESVIDRAAATRRELEIKSLSRQEKLNLINNKQD